MFRIWTHSELKQESYQNFTTSDKKTKPRTQTEASSGVKIAPINSQDLAQNIKRILVRILGGRMTLI